MRPHEHLTDAELVQLLLTTEAAALREELCVEFVYRFQPVIARTAKRRIARYTRRLDLCLVDDLVQDTFIKIFKDELRVLRNFEFRHENALRSFLKVMAAHVVDDHFRKPRPPEEELPDTTPDPADFRATFALRMKLEKIEDCLQKLAGELNFPRDYKTFWLYFRDGFTAKEIAHLPDLGFNTVKGVESALLRMIKLLRKCLEPY